MKRLTLIRHAKSSWDCPGLEDIDRPLNQRGRKDAPLMGGVLARRGFAPQRLISSPALRALRTAQALVAALGRPPSALTLDDRWYHLDAAGLLEVLRSLDPQLDWVACVGHNPALTELAKALGAQGLDNLPTGAVVEMDFETEHWHRLGRVAAGRVDIDRPKNHYG